MKQYQFILNYNGVDTELSINPAGWDNLGVSFIRNITYHSVLRSCTLSLRFAKKTGGGTDVILSAYNIEGISAIVNITINRRNPKTNGYELFYQGVLDLKPGKLIIERDFVEAGVMDTMKLQRFISRDNINYDVFGIISADNVSITPFAIPYKIINLPPIDFILGATATNSISGNAFCPNGQTSADIVFSEAPIFTKNEIGERFPLNALQVYSNSTDFDAYVKIDLNGLFSTTGYVDNRGSIVSFARQDVILMVIYYDADGNRINNGGDSYDFYGDTYNTAQFVTQYTWNVDPLHKNENLSFNSNINVSFYHLVPAGGYIEIKTFYGLFINEIPGNSSSFNQIFNASVVLQEYSFGNPQTTSKCLFPFEAFTRLIQLTTSETDTSKLFDSNFLGRTDSEFKTYSINGEGSLDAIMAARMIRNYPNEPLTINLRDLFKTFDSIYNLGLGYDRINDRFYVEKKEKFYDGSYFMFSLGEVKELKITPMSEGYFNQILGGTAFDGNYEEIQGAYEFNLQREYATSVPVKEDKDIRTTYFLDSVGVEALRRKQYYDNASKDSRLDKNTYIVRTDGNKAVTVTNTTGFQGIEKYYNAMLTPRQNAVRWGNILKAGLYKNNNPITFQKAAKLINMTYDGKDELSNIQQSELTDPALFIPEIYTFKSIINSDVLAVINTNPHGYIRFTFRGGTYEGFVNKIEAGDYTLEANYELIAKQLSYGENFIFEDNTNFVTEENENFVYE